ncbi:MAG: hypothetical protein CMQ34_08975 [Gammaproteobacteria bacterium]|mgnify:CR=1 FL=1|nr:hypothetical protein [Gammaproteobacteria bacterium]|tara:strand:- start:1260 stop:1712 length:453 start_codon:yes stop_codon:yes gene_type:complete
MLAPFRVRRSGLLAVFYGVMHLAAVAALLISALPRGAPLLIAPLLIVHGIVLMRRATLADGNALAAVHVDDTDILLELVNGRRIPAQLSGIYCVTGLQVAHFRRQGRDTSPGFWLTVLPDSAGPHTRRQLRTWLLTVPLSLTSVSTQIRD